MLSPPGRTGRALFPGLGLSLALLACGGPSAARDARPPVDDGGAEAAADAPETDDAARDTAVEGGGSVDADSNRCTFLAAGPADLTRALSAWPDRDFNVHVPPGYDCHSAVPLLLAIHGGGGNKDGFARASCPGGYVAGPDTSDPWCLNNVADREGFVVVYPNGTPNTAGVRGFNAGGGVHGYACINDYTCREHVVDDVAYFRQLLDDIDFVMNIDAHRVYSTGLSNGGAMSHRLACELSDRIAAIAAVGGQAQLAVSDPARCTPTRPVPVMVIHGTNDLCWPYDDPPGSGEPGELACGGAGTEGGLVASVEQTTDFWSTQNGCTGSVVNPIDDTPSPDGDATATRTDFTGCTDNGEVTLVRIENGGHTWPGGWQYLPAALIGGTIRDFSGSDLIWEFLSAHRL